MLTQRIASLPPALARLAPGAGTTMPLTGLYRRRRPSRTCHATQALIDARKYPENPAR
jgi:hypothetical protein